MPPPSRARERLPRGRAPEPFFRTQAVTEVYRWMEGGYRLVVQPFVEDWSAERKREKAPALLSPRALSYGAFDAGRPVGFILLDKGLREGAMIVDSFHVSADYRHQGIGRALFSLAVGEGRQAGADRLYISACSSKETIGFYRAMGCVPARIIFPEMAADEPFDLQLEYPLGEALSGLPGQ